MALLWTIPAIYLFLIFAWWKFPLRKLVAMVVAFLLGITIFFLAAVIKEAGESPATTVRTMGIGSWLLALALFDLIIYHSWKWIAIALERRNLRTGEAASEAAFDSGPIRLEMGSENSEDEPTNEGPKSSLRFPPITKASIIAGAVITLAFLTGYLVGQFSSNPKEPDLMLDSIVLREADLQDSPIKGILRGNVYLYNDGETHQKGSVPITLTPDYSKLRKAFFTELYSRLDKMSDEESDQFFFNLERKLNSYTDSYRREEVSLFSEALRLLHAEEPLPDLEIQAQPSETPLPYGFSVLVDLKPKEGKFYEFSIQIPEHEKIHEFESAIDR